MSQSQKTQKWIRRVGLVALLVGLFLAVQIALANVYPQYLKNGRTYDQESSYIQWNGSVGYISLYHRDGTTLPPSEGGGSCGSGCTEQVTRIQNGGSISGNFTLLKTINVQVATTGDSASGTAIIRACGQVIATQNLYLSGGGTPGFNNYPNPAWNVPTAGDCTWSVSATGGYVDFRAVTTAFRSAPAPTVDLKVNGSDGPLNSGAPATYTLSWSTTNAAECTASGSWSGAQLTNGSQAYANVSGGLYTYTLTCTNPSGSASDSVTVNVLSAPMVSITVPSAQTAPASYSVTWASSNAASCTGADRFTGVSGLNASKTESSLPAGTYTYSVTCTNAAGSASDSKQVIVYAAPSVDLKVDGSDGPTIYRTGPVSYIASWTSSNTTQCSGSSRLIGYSGLSGSRSETNISAGTSYDYSVTCQNAAGATVSDSVHMVVEAAPSVDVKVNTSDGPLNFFEPAAYTLTWTSSNAASCMALDNLTGPIGINGSKAFSAVLQGTYRYIVRCQNDAGTTASDTVLVNINPLPPVVDLKIEGRDGPVTLVSPAVYQLSWSTQYASSCVASSSDNGWTGSVAVTGSQSFSGILTGTHTYTLTCSNVSGSIQDTVTAYIIAPLSGTIAAWYPNLVLLGPKLGLPAQTLSGTVIGGQAPYGVMVYIKSPSGNTTTTGRNGSNWSLTPVDAGDPNFGTTENGVWAAWAVITDSVGRRYTTSSITWNVAWFPVHGRP